MINVIGHISFITPLFVGLILYGIRVPKRKYYWVTISISYFFMIAFFIIVMNNVVLLAYKENLNNDLILTIRVFFAFLAYVFLFITSILTYKTNFFIYFYLVTCSYTTQHLSRTCVNIIELLLPNNKYYFDIIYCLICWTIVYPACYLIFENKQKNNELTISNKYQLVIGSIPITFCIFLNSFGSAKIESNIAKLIFDIFVLTTTFLSLFLEYLMTRGKNVEQENIKIKKMLNEQKEQYLFEKQLIDLVNTKAHDLKYQMNDNGMYSLETIKNTKRLIGDYDASYNTGLSPLDIILTKKSRECNRHQITLTCMVNGECLLFIEEIDLYSLFGNIIDNAIEASRKIEDKNERSITLTVVKKEGFVLIHESNYYVGNLNMENNIPITTKKDTDYHGYGIKSIKLICDKYEGSFKITLDKNIFNLDIIFPINN